MPTYEYRCSACEHQFEIEQRITDPKLEKCPSCKKKKLVRQVGAGNFILKGGGWYKDLYSSTPSKKSGEDKGSSDSPKSESKDDKKAAPKTDASKSEPSKSEPRSDKKEPKKAKAD